MAKKNKDGEAVNDNTPMEEARIAEVVETFKAIARSEQAGFALVVKVTDYDDEHMQVEGACKVTQFNRVRSLSTAIQALGFSKEELMLAIITDQIDFD